MIGRLKNESGFALILTLVITALMVAVVVEMIHQVYVDTSLSRSFRDGQQASILAESGATGAAKLLQLGLSQQGYSSLSDQWATPLKLDDEAGSIQITISEESGKINVNDVAHAETHEALQRLGLRLKLPGEIWAALSDWVDSDDIPSSGGAESVYYLSLKPPYKARNGKLATLTELSLVKGFTPEVIGKLRPYLTTFSTMDKTPYSLVNINTAPKEVLVALDSSIDDRMAERIMEQRNIKAFENMGNINSQVPGTNQGLGKGLISFKGTAFRITSVAKVKDSGRTVEAVVRLSGSMPQILSWQEY